MWAAIALGYHIVSRLAYVIGIGVSLTQEKRHQVFTRHEGVEAGFRRFRRLSLTLMNNDALSFIFLCLMTRDTLSFDLPDLIRYGGGGVLILIGVGIKRWAATSLGAGAYHWRDVFDPPTSSDVPAPKGPYRLIQNPMYTIGYVHAYGFALITGSGWGLLAAAFDQTAMLVFHHLVEKPHYSSLTRASST